MSAVMESTQIAEYRPIEAALAMLAEKYDGVVWNVRVPAEMKSAREARAELRDYRVSLEKKRVEIKAPALERTRLIDAEAKRITKALEALEDPISEQIRAEEGRKEREREAEVERIAQIRQCISELNLIVPAMAGKSSVEISARIDALRVTDVAEWAAELLPEAQKAHAAAIQALQQLCAGALAQEQAQAAEVATIAAERAELAKLKAEQAERDRAEQARVAEETRTRLEAEAQAKSRIAEAERASREKIEAEERQARLVREEADRKSRQEREAAEAKLKAERDQIDAAQREERKKQAELTDAEGMLNLFVVRYSNLPQFAPICNWIAKYFAHKHV